MQHLKIFIFQVLKVVETLSIIITKRTLKQPTYENTSNRET